MVHLFRTVLIDFEKFYIPMEKTGKISEFA